MRIVVSGTHASGKSTLISDFAVRHPGFTVLPDPFELLDETGSAPSAALFSSQLRISADRLACQAEGGFLIAERGPLDFLAYLLALADLSGHPLDEVFLEQAIARTAKGISAVDVLVVLPLTRRDRIYVGPDEYLELRNAMNYALLDLLDDPDVVGETITVAEITGTPDERLAALEMLVRDAVQPASNTVPPMVHRALRETR